ncbi:SGNH/GDSL hydrolase family protein [Gelidibacter mesophilus]|uniref:SGNH/GDSL hydrolase family protein n=1 Tax=Gelidibacter mesophilus TaxID=169050 RepID=UPI000489E5F6|nr:SGNH/GDSL hydrolase family protein [Gelidibacter mesophilus]
MIVYKRSLSIILLCIVTATSQAQDWPNLKRYQNENAALTSPKLDEHRIVFMGNSITEGWGKKHPEFFMNNAYINRGIGGQTTPQMLLRFRQDVIDLNPVAVVILAGTNDIAENTGPSTIKMIINNVISMAELAKANNIKVVLCSVLPAFEFPWRQGLEPAGKVVRLNALIKKYANDHDIVYVDYFTPMANSSNGLKDELGDDGIHPNINGYLIMEPLIEEGIRKSLENK